MRMSDAAIFGLAAACAFVIAIACSPDEMTPEELERWMLSAVKEENYELAAVIRDEIARMG